MYQVTSLNDLDRTEGGPGKPLRVPLLNREGAKLISASEMIVASSPDHDDLLYLGVPPDLAERVRKVASMIIRRARDLRAIDHRVAVSAPIRALADSLTDDADANALDTLLDIADRYSSTHPRTKYDYLWETKVLRTIDNGEAPGLSQASSQALATSIRAYRARKNKVGEILDRLDWEQAAMGNVLGGPDAMASLVGSRSLHQLFRRIRAILTAKELEAFEAWASQVAGERLTLP